VLSAQTDDQAGDEKNHRPEVDITQTQGDAQGHYADRSHFRSPVPGKALELQKSHAAMTAVAAEVEICW
jgi:hypothetical protein